jgi:hypothetical protein
VGVNAHAWSEVGSRAAFGYDRVVRWLILCASSCINEQGGALLCSESLLESRELGAIIDPHVEHSLSGYRGSEVRLIRSGFEELEIRVLPKDVDSRVAPLATVPLNGLLSELAELISKK